MTNLAYLTVCLSQHTYSPGTCSVRDSVTLYIRWKNWWWAIFTVNTFAVILNKDHFNDTFHVNLSVSVTFLSLEHYSFQQTYTVSTINTRYEYRYRICIYVLRWSAALMNLICRCANDVTVYLHINLDCCTIWQRLF